MKIMSINAGSSSLKFSLFNMDTEEVIASGLFERIGIENGHYVIKFNGEKIEQNIDLENHEAAVRILMDKLVDLDIISSLEDIDGIGHRITAGGEKYVESVVIDDKVIEDLFELKDFAPLHNPAQATAIKAFREVLPNTLMTAVFDTTFHQSMDKEQYLYAAPLRWYKEYKVRKYGAHGTSHRFVSEEISKKLGRQDLRTIVCHVGNGGSITAVKDGKCIDTSMGFTPLSGIIMGTRSGDIYPSILPYVMERDGLNVGEAIDVLNKQSGLLGMSEKSSDMRDIIAGMNEGDEKCLLAFNKYCRAITNYIAQYYVLLGGADVICFTAGVGENSIPTRAKVCENLACLGIKIDPEANNVFGEFKKISTPDSAVEVYVVPTNEELMIARDTLFLSKNN